MLFRFGAFSNPGIPAAVVTKYLAEHGIIVEKTGLYSFFIMFTIGITKGRWNTLVTELQQFKDDYDNNRPLWRILPEFVGKYPQYEKVGLRDLCSQIHGVYKANDIARLTTEMYLSNMEPAMRPADAPDADGPANLRDAIRVASTPGLSGVLMVCDGQVFEGHVFQKVRTEGVQPFEAEPIGVVGECREIGRAHV